MNGYLAQKYRLLIWSCESWPPENWKNSSLANIYDRNSNNDAIIRINKRSNDSNNINNKITEQSNNR